MFSRFFIPEKEGARMKRRFWLAIGLVLILGLVLGCGSEPRDQGETATKAAPPKRQVALVMKTLTNPFFVEMEKGARQAERELDVNLIVKTGAKETSIEQQIAIVDELIRNRVDAIVIAPASSVEIIPMLRKAREAKIVIVNIDNQLDPDVSRRMGLDDVPFISVDNEKGAYLSAKFISDQIRKPTKVAILEGIRTARNAGQRKAGALKAFRENPNARVVAMATANWKIDEAYEVTARLFQKDPDIGALFCANDMMALGAIHYLKQAKKAGVLVAGFDALDEAQKALREGSLQVTVDQQAARQGYLGVRTAVDMLAGQRPAALTRVEALPLYRERK